MQIKKIVDFLLNKYPLKNKEIWDPSGFSVKFNQREKIKGVVLAIDLTNEVLEKAIDLDANLIITHHPFKFEQKWSDEKIKAPYKENIRNKLKEKRISVISFHTNYDNDENGTSHEIAKQLGLDSFIVKYDSNYPCLLNVNISFNEIVNLFKNKLGFSAFRSNLPKEHFNRLFSKVAILSGSGYITEVNKLNFEKTDLIITSDIKWSDWIVYKETNASILEVPHLDEQVFMEKFEELLKNEFNDLKITKVYLKEPYYNL